MMIFKLLSIFLFLFKSADVDSKTSNEQIAQKRINDVFEIYFFQLLTNVEKVREEVLKKTKDTEELYVEVKSYKKEKIQKLYDETSDIEEMYIIVQLYPNIISSEKLFTDLEDIISSEKNIISSENYIH